MVYTEFHIHKVYLMLGGACNYKCRHCIQKEAETVKQGYVSDKVVNYIQHLAKMRPATMGRITVMFWGGEPLLYLKTIKEVIKKLQGSVDYAMVSNGSLIDDQTVEFLNQHNINYILSNDGYKTINVRGENILDNPDFVERFNQIANKAIDSVISAYNQDYYALWEYIDNMFPDIPIYAEFLQCTWDMPDDLYNFDLIAYEKMLKRIVKKAYDDTLKGNFSREVQLLSHNRDAIIRIAKKIKENENPFIYHAACNQMRRAINIDTLGNVYACHNFTNQLGTVEDDYETLVMRYDQTVANFMNRVECRECEHVVICRGGCPFVQKSEGKEKCCEVMKIFMNGCIEYVEMLSKALEPVEL